VLAVLPALAAGCAAPAAGGARAGGAGGSGGTVPEGPRALGVEFGRPRADVEAGLRAGGAAVDPAPGDDDALRVNPCPGFPGPCTLVFGAAGLYAAQVERPEAEAGALVERVADGLGAPARRGAEAPTPGAAALVAAWDRPGWTVTVSRVAPARGAPAAVLRYEYEPAAPPVVAGVPLGRRRIDAEHVLERQGAVVQARDPDATTYLGCPEGDPEALTCIVAFRGGRAASVTEVLPAAPDDRSALATWRVRVAGFEADIGRPPERTSCPDAGPDRVAGDCTATWASDRLVVVVGALRGAGGKHRGAISVYTAFTWPPLAAEAPPGP
jgi:hypothetical protein